MYLQMIAYACIAVSSGISHEASVVETSYIKTKNSSPMNQLSTEGNDPEAEEGARCYFQMVEVEGIGHLSCDLVIKLLSRLPAKDLCKLRLWLPSCIERVQNSPHVPPLCCRKWENGMRDSLF